jgi:hypothetical protein
VKWKGMRNQFEKDEVVTRIVGFIAISEAALFGNN